MGFGVDMLGLLSVKLDGGRGTKGTQLLPVHDDGRPADDFGRLGVAGKMRISRTELKVGEWMPVLPILRSDDGRSLPQTFQGGMLTSKEITGLTLHGGQFRQNSPRNDASMEDMSAFGATSDRFNYAGGEYRFNQERTLVGVWYAELQDIYNQQYFNLVHSQPVGDWTLGANLGYFIGGEDGDELAGELDNKTASGLFSAKYGAHTFYVGLQKVSGDNAWMRVNGTSGGTLANDSFNASFDNPDERSAQVRYDYDFAALGVPRSGQHGALHQGRRHRRQRQHRRRRGVDPRHRAGLHRAGRPAEGPQRQVAHLEHPQELGEQRHRLRRARPDRQLSAEHLLIACNTGRSGSGGRLLGILSLLRPSMRRAFFRPGLLGGKPRHPLRQTCPAKVVASPPKLRGNPHDSRSRSGLTLSAGIMERPGDDVWATSRVAPPGLNFRQQRQEGPDCLTRRHRRPVPQP
ncbi:Porin-like protein NicP precursor [compost metagenome]